MLEIHNNAQKTMWIILSLIQNSHSDDRSHQDNGCSGDKDRVCVFDQAIIPEINPNKIICGTLAESCTITIRGNPDNGAIGRYFYEGEIECSQITGSSCEVNLEGNRTMEKGRIDGKQTHNLTVTAEGPNILKGADIRCTRINGVKPNCTITARPGQPPSALLTSDGLCVGGECDEYGGVLLDCMIDARGAGKLVVNAHGPRALGTSSE